MSNNKLLLNELNNLFTEFLKNNYVDNDIIEKWNKKNKKKIKQILEKINKPPLPIKPISKYMHFCNETRPIIQQEYIGKNIKISIQDITCELGKRWKEFKSNPDKELYKKITNLYNNDMERYYNEKKNIYNITEKNYLRSKYIFFCAEERIKNKNIKLKELSILWNKYKNDKELNDRYNNCKILSKKFL